jgi:hypothetical protein
MESIKRILQNVRENKVVINFFMIVFIFFVCFQQWTTFKKYIHQFESPIQYTQENFGNDYVSKYEDRIPELKTFLSHSSNIGYYSEPDQDMPTFYLHYVLTQYYLTPTLISKRADRDTILYNLYNSNKIDVLNNEHLKHGWHIVKDFNNGFILLSK